MREGYLHEPAGVFSRRFAQQTIEKNPIFGLVGGDAHIAPQKICRINNAFRQICIILHRADVGIGPYGTLLRQPLA